MKKSQIAAGVLSSVLLMFLGLSFRNGAGDLRLRCMLVFGSVLGAIYAVKGELPPWLLSAASIHADDSPENISPKIYLPVLLATIIAAITWFVIVSGIW